jgi:ABC-type transport system involved in multi-copper enzyme maturation permease subunit
MNTLRAVGTVLRFEMGRTATLGRIAFGLALALFPAAIVALLQYEGAELRGQRVGLVLFALVPQIVTLVSLLLWATPAVYGELEGQTWVYLAVRPAGKTALLLGKYLTAILWTFLVDVVAVSIALAIAGPEEVRRLWVVGVGVSALACAAYGALYVLIGVVFLRRAMVAAVAYTFVSEFLVTWIPANIHHLTVQYHLRGLAMKWMRWESLHVLRDIQRDLILTSAPVWQHLATLAAFVVVLLTAAAIVLRQRQALKADDA